MPIVSSAPALTRAGFLLASAAAGLSPTACSSTSASDGGSGSSTTLRIGELGSAPTERQKLDAAGEGEDLAYGLEHSLFYSGPAFMEAVPSGAVDLALMADTPAIFAQVGGTPVKVIGVQASTPEDVSSVEIVAQPDSGFTTGYSYVVATDAALADEAKVEAIGDYLGRLGRALQWSHDNPEQWAPTYASLTGLSEEVSLAILERSSAGRVPIDETVIAAQQEQADVCTELGLIAEPLDVSTEYDDRFDDLLTGADQ